MSGYFQQFIKEEDGMETIEFMIILAVIAGLIAIIAGISSKLTQVGKDANTKIEGGLNEIGTALRET